MKIGEDKVKHFCVSFFVALIAGIVAAVSQGEPTWAAAIIAALIGMGVGIAKEIYDKKTTGLFDWWDIVADAIGVAAGIGLLFLIV